MKKYIVLFFLLVILCAAVASAQAPLSTAVQILKAEDARRYDATLENLMHTANADIRLRAALAAGRIGDERAIPVLSDLLANDRSTDVRAMAAFALGEIESLKGSDAILKVLVDGWRAPVSVLARAVEAAGKIVAANPKDDRSKTLGAAMLHVLESQAASPMPADVTVVRLGLTAILRARPEGGDLVTAKFLVEPDSRLRADAANTLTRLKAKNANEALRKMLATDADAAARANAARALGAAEDKAAFDILLKAATDDIDARVRVSAIRALGNLKDAKAADRLLERGERLLADAKSKGPGRPVGQSEFIEIAAALGRMLANTRNERAVDLIRQYGKIDSGLSAEIYIARMRISPGRGDDKKPALTNWHQYSTMAQLVGEFATIEAETDEARKMKSEAPGILRPLVTAYTGELSADDQKTLMAAPDVLRAYAAFKTTDLSEVLRAYLKTDDVIMRATAAELLAEQPSAKENREALKTGFSKALLTDKHDNDAQLAILDALYKLDKKESVGTLLVALTAPDYLVRKKAFELLEDKDLQKDFPGIPTSLENARTKHKDQVLPYSPAFGTKLGQVLNTDTDYRRALSRKDGTVKAVITTEKGTFTIGLMPEHAPLTVDNFIKLARSGYFNGLEVHRVVPNFVMQDGDPRGDGNGGPGWSIRCEINTLPYDRGAVGMALSGKDTGGSQWFVTHSPQPHLDGGYTVFGHVNETDMKVVDNIVRGDKIISVRIVEGRSPQRHRGTENGKK